MESLVVAVLILGTTLILSGPTSLYLSFREETSFFVLAFFSLLAITSGIYWSWNPSGARWLGLISVGLGAFALYRRINF